MKITKTIRTGLVGVLSVFALALSFVPMSVASAVDPDTQAPIVSVVSPVNNATVKKNSTVNITVATSDNVGVTQVDYYARDTSDPETCGSEGCPDYLVCTGSATSCAWHVPNMRGVMYEVTAVAHDAAGNSTVSTSVFVRVP